ncbi:Twinfilin-1 [Arachnomyces sp. PD_36]|nr:Twinfilin-1 [Arachnomyces sp. PD_36]
MQSGISVSPELHSAFTTFLSTPTLFSLPITITSERLVPLDPIPFSSSSSSSNDSEQFLSSLPLLTPHLEPKTPIYIIIRRAPSPDADLVALTYVPSNSPVRAKTLFASTRSTLTRELGSEKFNGGGMFATEVEEVIGREAWGGEGGGEGGESGGVRREDLMGEKERELDAVRRAEDEARSGTRGRDVGMNSGGGSGGGAKIASPVGEGVREALRGIEGRGLVQLGIDIPTETIVLIASQSNVSLDSVSSHISDSVPRYTFYRPDSSSLIFAYSCPPTSSIKERMLYASCRRNIVVLAEGEGLEVSRKIEASSPEEVAEHLQDGNEPEAEAPKRGFARPKRPGR